MDMEFVVSIFWLVITCFPQEFWHAPFFIAISKKIFSIATQTHMAYIKSASTCGTRSMDYITRSAQMDQPRKVAKKNNSPRK